MAREDLFEHTFNIVELYTNNLNIYGDTGNSLVLKKRFSLYGLKSRIINYNIGDSLIDDIDIIVSGGGQDKAQIELYDDLKTNQKTLVNLSKNGVPMLVICGMYQLFGNYFLLSDGTKLDGLGIFNMFTEAKKINKKKDSQNRIIGNIVTQSKMFGKLVGYENHSGQTFLGKNQEPLSDQIILGVGNQNSNGEQLSEGAIYKNTIGTYMHGPFLPRNPLVADFLITQAVQNFLGHEVILQSDKVDKIDELSEKARNIELNR